MNISMERRLVDEGQCTPDQVNGGEEQQPATAFQNHAYYEQTSDQAIVFTISTSGQHPATKFSDPTIEPHVDMAVLACLCCCFPGIIALICAILTKSAIRNSDVNAASLSKAVLMLSRFCIITGFVLNITWIGYMIYKYTT